MSNSSESYNLKFGNKKIDAIVLFDDNDTPMAVQVYGPLDSLEKAAFNKCCSSVNDLIKKKVFKYQYHKASLLKQHNIDPKIIKFFEQYVFSLMKIT
jgi:hypothetical protein